MFTPKEKDNKNMLEVDGVQETKRMIMIDLFKMSLKDGNDGIHYILLVTKIFQLNEFS